MFAGVKTELKCWNHLHHQMAFRHKMELKPPRFALFDNPFLMTCTTTITKSQKGDNIKVQITTVEEIFQ